MNLIFNYAYNWLFPKEAAAEIPPKNKGKQEVSEGRRQRRASIRLRNSDSKLVRYVKYQSEYEELTRTTRLFEATTLDAAAPEFEKIQKVVANLLNQMGTLSQTREVENLQNNLINLHTVAEETVKSLINQEKKQELLPVSGIIRLGNNCWAGASLQFLFNIPSLEKLILSDQGSNTIRGLFKKYKQAQEKGMAVASGVDSSRLRKFVPSVSKENIYQEDAWEAVAHILNRSNYSISLETTNVDSGNRTRDPTTIIELNLPPSTSKKKKAAIPFQDLISSNFVRQDDLGRPLFDKIVKLPSDLFVRAKRFTQDHKKIDTKIDVPLQFDFPAEHTIKGKKNTYECQGAIIHLGTTLGSGHYVSIIKKENQWFLIDDAQVAALTDEEAQEYLSKAYLFNFRKIG